MNEPRPITRVEVTDKNRTLRIIAAVVLAVIGAIGITTGIMTALNRETGWQTVVVAPKERSCSNSFTFRYNFEGSGAQVAAVNRQLEAAYEEACVKAYRLFTADEAVPGVNNVHYINHHPNEVIPVDALLYDAFSQLEETGYLFLGPAYAHYYNLIISADETMVSAMDPASDPETMAYVNQIAAFAADREHIRLELLGENQIKLHVSREYLEFAQTEEIETFIDFAYMTNAFIIDYLADTLEGIGLTKGYLVSNDGYTRNLCREGTFSVSVFDKAQEGVYPAGSLEYRGPISMVCLKSYPTEESMVNYRWNGDHFISLYADPADGRYRTAVDDLLGYSYTDGCAQVLLRMLPSFVGDSFTVPEGVFSVWCQEKTICYNDETISIGDLLQNAQVSYRAELRK